MKILVVDDDVDLLRMLEKLLVDRGHEVHACATPFGVAALVLRETPHVVVLDMMMPGLSGGELADTIRGLDVTPAPKLVLWSAMDEDQLLDEGVRLGVPVVSKAQRPSRLVDVIEKL